MIEEPFDHVFMCTVMKYNGIYKNFGAGINRTKRPLSGMWMVRKEGVSVYLHEINRLSTAQDSNYDMQLNCEDDTQAPPSPNGITVSDSTMLNHDSL